MNRSLGEFEDWFDFDLTYDTDVLNLYEGDIVTVGERMYIFSEGEWLGVIDTQPTFNILERMESKIDKLIEILEREEN